MNTPAVAIARARSMLHVPFLHLGRDANGIDCIGLVAYAYGYAADKLPAYPRDPYRNELQQGLNAVLGAPVLVYPVQVGSLRPGDVLAMAFGRPVRHVALVAEHPTLAGALSIIQTDSTLGKVTEHILDAKWLRRVREVYRT